MARRAHPEPAYRVDLHGLGVERALARLERELAHCRLRGLSPVLVITGRGWGSAGGNPVLAPAVRRWLQGSEGRRLGVAECRPVHRGGALWVRIASDA